MASRDPAKPAPDPEIAQALVGFMSNDDWDLLLADVNRRIESMEELPAGDVKLQVFELLQGVDAIHREALRRLVRLFKEGVLEKVVSDPAIHTLMELYDLLPLQGEESWITPSRRGSSRGGPRGVPGARGSARGRRGRRRRPSSR